MRFSAASPTVVNYLVFKSVRPPCPAVLSIFSSSPLSSPSPSSVCVQFLASEDFSGEEHRERRNQGEADREMALVKRRGCRFRFLKLH